MGGAMGGAMGGTISGSSTCGSSSSLTTRSHDQNPQHNEMELQRDLKQTMSNAPTLPMIKAIEPAISFILKSANCPIFIILKILS